MHHGWLVKGAFVDLPVRLKGNSKNTCIKPLSPLGTPKNDLVSALQMCLVTSLLAWILPLSSSGRKSTSPGQLVGLFSFQAL